MDADITSDIKDSINLFKNKFISSKLDQTVKINEQQTLLDEITDEYRLNKNAGIYNYFKNINREYLLFYFFCVILFYNIINYIDFNTKNIFSLFIAIFIIYLINDRNDFLYLDEMKKLEIKLGSIYPQPKYFHLDSGFIDLIYSIKDFRTMSEKIFDDLVLEIDSFLEVEEIFYNETLDKLHNLYDILKDKRKKILNIFHSFIFNISSFDKISIKQLQITKDSLHYILNIHIRNMRLHINKIIKKNPTNIFSKEILFDEEEEPDDPFRNKNFDFYY